MILGKEANEFVRGAYNRGLFETAVETLDGHFEIMTTVIEDGYDVAHKIAKFGRADLMIYQHPVFRFTMPPGMKRYIDEVYAYDAFFTFNDGPYGSGGQMTGRKLVLSTTWNAPA